MRANALIHVAERRVECREVLLAAPGKGEVLIRSRCSAISAGTEAMIFSGAFPKNTALDPSIESLQGTFAYPFSYGYALVGDVCATGPGVDEGLIGQTLFAFHPHQDTAVVPVAGCHRVPDGVPPEAALFLPQVETALNLVMDGAPLIGERVLVFGQGVVGLLTARLLAEFPLARLVAVEPLAWRRELARECGVAETVDPADAGVWQPLLAGLNGADLIFELSGDMAALNQAIEAAGFDGRIVVGSWYGVKSQPLDLGGRFHRNRLRLISSQVSTLNPALTGRWDKPRRMDLAWRMVKKLEPQRLVSQSFPLAECQQAFEAVSTRRDAMMQVIFRTEQVGMPVAFADFLQAKFALDERSLNREVRAAFLDALNRLPQIHCLDVGAGTGATLQRLLESELATPLSMTALDRDPGLLDIARRKAEIWQQDKRLAAIRFAVDDMKHHRPERLYNVVTAHAFLDLAPLPEALRLFATWLQPGGYLYASANYDGDTVLRPLYDDADFEVRLLEHYNDTMESRRVDGQVTGGAYCGSRLQGLLPEYGFDILAHGNSDWNIAPVLGEYRDGDSVCLKALLEMIYGEGQRSQLRQVELDRWHENRLRLLQERQLKLAVRQLDLLARYRS